MVALRSIDVRATCRRPPAGAVAEGAAQVEDMGTPVVAMDLELCECRLGIRGQRRVQANRDRG